MKLTRVLIIIPGFIPSTIIGIMRPLAELEAHGEIELRCRISGFSPFLSSDIAWCDVVVFCRNCEINDLYTLYEVKRRGKRVVYELDDNFEEIPLSTNIGVHHRAFFRLHVLRRFFLLSDVVRIYSDRLEERALAHGAKVQKIRSYFNKSLIEGLQKRINDGVVRIAYPTGRIDDRNLEELLYSSVKVILEKYTGRVEFHLWRKDIPKQLSGIPGVVLNEGVGSYDEFIRFFYQSGFDIGLAPVLDGPFFQSKTNNKYREFGGCSIAGVYSNTPPYSNSLIHERQGLLAGGTVTEWVEAIERLIVDTNLRREIVKNAREDVFENYSLERAIESWRECFNRLEDIDDQNVPAWLPGRRNVSIVASVKLGAAGSGSCDSARDVYLRAACDKIRGCSCLYFNNVTEYLKCENRAFFCVTIFKIGNKKDLDTLLQVIGLSTSAIIDLTKYTGDLVSAVQQIKMSISGVPISFLFSSDQGMGGYQGLNIDAVEIKVDADQIGHEYSLLGYPAAYLDVVERHACYLPLTRSSIVKRFGLKVANLLLLYKYKLALLARLLKWRVGVRGF